MDSKIKKVDYIDFGTSGMVNNNVSNVGNVSNVEEVILDDEVLKGDVLNSIKANFDNNKRVTDQFNKAIYMGLKDELSNLSLNEVNNSRGSR